jgi:hypothetical protein
VVKVVVGIVLEVVMTGVLFSLDFSSFMTILPEMIKSNACFLSFDFWNSFLAFANTLMLFLKKVLTLSMFACI